MKDSELINELKQATQNLQWMSESEAPFEIVTWDCKPDRFDEQKLLQLTDHSEDSPIETVEFDQFFAVPTQVQAWQSEDEIAIAHQYQTLTDVLKQHLQNLKVYRVGEVELDVYILGNTDDTIAGLSTKAIET